MTSWNNLPLELLKEIFKLTYADTDKRTLYECVFVCKNWKTPALELLYHTLTFTNHSPLMKIFKTLKRNVELGNLVRKIILFDYPIIVSPKSNSFYVVEKLLECVPNLDTFEDTEGRFYAALIPALIESKLTKLRRLICLEVSEYVDNYIVCAILLKDRLENLSIHSLPVLGERNSGIAQFRRLYDRLEGFKNLNELYIEKATNNYIEFLQETERRSPSLKSLNFCLLQDSRAVNNKLVPKPVIPEPVIPKPLMEKLVCSIKIDNAILCYIMQRYPNLTYLCIKDVADEPLDFSTLVQFFNYALKRDTVIVYCLCAESVDLTNAIGACQDVNKLLKTLEFNFSITASFDLPTQSLIHINKDPSENQHTFTIRYNDHELERPHNILEKYGRSVKSLIYRLVWNNLQDRPDFDFDQHCGDSIVHALKYCPDLEGLEIETSSNLDKISPPGKEDVNTRTRLITLHISFNKMLSSKGLKNLSLHIAAVESLIITVDRASLHKTTVLCFDMMDTEIDDLTLFIGNQVRIKTIRLKLYTEDIGECYYIYDVQMKNFVFKVSDEQEYLKDFKKRIDQRIEFSCESLQILKVYFVPEFNNPITLDLSEYDDD